MMILAFLAIAYHSVYFRKLDAYKALLSSKEFNAGEYAKSFWTKKLLPAVGGAIDINQLWNRLEADAPKAFKDYGHVLGISNERFFLVHGTGVVLAINENDISVLVGTDSIKRPVKIETEFIFGNAVRDASGLIDINEFSNTMDFNNVSAEINKIIRTDVVPLLRSEVKKDMQIDFVGAIKLNQEHLNLSEIETIPIQIKIIR